MQTIYRNYPTRTNPPSRIYGAIVLALVVFVSGYLAVHMVVAIIGGWL